MTKQEFLYALEAALSEELNSIQVNEQINYYRPQAGVLRRYRL